MVVDRLGTGLPQAQSSLVEVIDRRQASFSSLYDTFRKIVAVEDRILRLTDEIKRLSAQFADHEARLARLEGKFDLVETAFSARRRRLPPARFFSL